VPQNNAFAGWHGRPVRCRVYGVVAGGSGAVTVSAAKSTIGCTVARITTGQYRLTFPACRDVADINIDVQSVDPDSDVSQAAQVDADSAETYAAKAASTTGSVKFTTYKRDTGVDDTELANGTVLDIAFTLDL
jgi:hypothetical protein